MSEDIVVSTDLITIPWDPGAIRAFDRDLLATAVLLRMDHPDNVAAVVDALINDHGVMTWPEAMTLTIGAGVCIQKGIEP